MAGLVKPLKAMRSPIPTRGLARGLFWMAGLGTVGALGVAFFAASEAGGHGFILLSGAAAAAFLLLYALAAGEAAGRSLKEKASRTEPPGATRLAYEALEYLDDPVVVTDRRGAARWGNAAYRELSEGAGRLGQSLGLPALDRVWPGGGDGAIYRLCKAAAAGEVRRERMPALCRDGHDDRLFDVEARPSGPYNIVWRFSPVHDVRTGGADAPVDWTDRSPVGLFSVSADGQLLEANTTLRSWLGIEAGQPLPALGKMLAGEGAKTVLKSRGNPDVSRVDARLLAREGVESPVAVAIEWETGKAPVGRAVVYGLSATGAPPGVAQAMTGTAPAKAGRTFDEMFVSAPFGVARLDNANPELSIIEDANPALMQLCGGSAVPGVRFADLFDWGEGRNAEETFAKAMSGHGEPAEVVLKGEPRRDAHLVFAAARGGKRAAYVIEITAWKELERQFAQGNKMQAVGQLAGGVAHDFNNLLTAIRLNTDELLGRHPVGDPSYGELQSINQTVARAAGLVRKLLAFSRKQTFRTETLELPDVLSDFSVLLRQILEESVKLEIVHGRQVAPIRADKGQLETAILNLAANARDAMRESGGGTLTIRTSMATADDVRAAGAPNPAAGDWVQIAVSDEGCGMSAETRDKIFEPFFTTKAAGQGTGLGLATVYGIVKQSGGFLFVDSEPGKGSTFRIFLPAYEPTEVEKTEAAEEKAAKAVEPEPADLAGRGRILLVEDEDAVRAIAAKTLTKRGYEVIEACDGEEALDIIIEQEGGFDLLISDVVMPGLDGPGLLEKARDRLGSTRVVFISGYAEEQFSKTLSAETDVSFLPKPFTLTQLAEKVKSEIGAAAKTAA
ncbi:ATP-binding protein [Hyphobacterium marinum]|uniref:histidine kinase n=1 Tax=Hyphobacterium marinum TaxID=3116574 RepID=A0ABU7LZA5_9PROT|nr:ATP-binding protein [Hyphobacterium sp. Y6023]MEE2566891.1 ATP-binding protein [Hyphobacterium sp. Y6023]